MNELSMILKINEMGELCMLDLTKEDGEIIIPRKTWEDAIIYSRMLEKINTAYLQALKDFHKKHEG
ncbi:hypothetical protein [Ekhidna sp.]|uniref:hypothetical protein n=1 Tax=Ekhidna sp. TaxID=2608089 RepID=UPI003B50A186